MKVTSIQRREVTRLPARLEAGQRGLTLVEMLVALVLSSIIFVSAYQVISNLVQYQVRARTQHDKHLDTLLLTNLFSQIIEMGVNQYDLFYSTQKSTLFQGTVDSLQMLSRAYSDRYDKPGYRVYRLYQRDGELYVSYRAYDQGYLANQQYQMSTGLRVENLKFAYLDSGNWVDEWVDNRSVPEFIRVSVDLPSFESVEWIRGTSRR